MSKNVFEFECLAVKSLKIGRKAKDCHLSLSYSEEYVEFNLTGVV